MNQKFYDGNKNVDKKDSGYDWLIRKLKQENSSDPRIKVLIKGGFAAFLKELYK